MFIVHLRRLDIMDAVHIVTIHLNSMYVNPMRD